MKFLGFVGFLGYYCRLYSSVVYGNWRALDSGFYVSVLGTCVRVYGESLQWQDVGRLWC